MNSIELHPTDNYYRIVTPEGKSLTDWQFGTLEQARERFGNRPVFKRN